MSLSKDKKDNDMEKDYTLYGTKIKNHKIGEMGLLICTWMNSYADENVDFTTCVDPKGKLYNIAMDFIATIEE